MLDYRVVHIGDKQAIYDYFVEGKQSQKGTISINLDTKKCSIDSLPEQDRHKDYAFHLMRRLEEMARDGEFRDSGTVMWY